MTKKEYIITWLDEKVTYVLDEEGEVLREVDNPKRTIPLRDVSLMERNGLITIRPI